jgi:hypothetical protein
VGVAGREGEREREKGREGEKSAISISLSLTHTHTHTLEQCYRIPGCLITHRSDVTRAALVFHSVCGLKLLVDEALSY